MCIEFFTSEYTRWITDLNFDASERFSLSNEKIYFIFMLKIKVFLWVFWKTSQINTEFIRNRIRYFDEATVESMRYDNI